MFIVEMDFEKKKNSEKNPSLLLGWPLKKIFKKSRDI